MEHERGCCYPGKRKDMRFPGFLPLFDKQNINTGIFEDSHAVKQKDGLMDNLLDKLSSCNNPSENNIRHFILTFITYVQDAVSIPITPLRNHNLIIPPPSILQISPYFSRFLAESPILC